MTNNAKFSLSYLTHWKMILPRYLKKKSLLTEIILKRREIFILPTRSGFLFALVLCLMLLGSMNYNNSMGYMLTFLLGSMAIVSTLHTHRNLLGLRITTGKVTPVFAGETIQFELLLDNQNHAARHVLGFERCLITTSWRPKTVAYHLVDVPENRLIPIYFAVPTEQRGHIALGKIMISTQFPLGLFRAWAYIQLDFSGLVYPAPQGHDKLPQTQSTDNNLQGDTSVGSGDDFIGYRNYQVGDSPRHIDWKAVARQQGWLIKQFGGGETIRQIWLNWENTQTTTVETALSQLCLWVLLADQQNAQYGLQLPHQQIELNVGSQHRANCLKALALFDEKSL